MNTADVDLEKVGRLFQAFADETRLSIVQMLCRGECCVCDLQTSVGAYQSRLSFHLRKLKEAGVVDDRRDGRWVYYELRPEALEEMRAFLSGIEEACSTSGTRGDDCCG